MTRHLKQHAGAYKDVLRSFLRLYMSINVFGMREGVVTGIPLELSWTVHLTLSPSQVTVPNIKE